MSVFHPANVTSDGWEAPQTPQSHSPAINSCATDLIPRPSVPKSQVEVGWGCILSCMGIRCIGCILYVYSGHAYVPARLSRYTAHTAHTAIQPYTPYIIQRHTASLSLFRCGQGHARESRGWRASKCISCLLRSVARDALRIRRGLDSFGWRAGRARPSPAVSLAALKPLPVCPHDAGGAIAPPAYAGAKC